MKSLWKKRKCCNSNKVENSGERLKSLEDYLEHERTKEPLGDFTLSEYNEKGNLLKDITTMRCVNAYDVVFSERSFGSEIRKSAVKQVDKSQISSAKR